MKLGQHSPGRDLKTRYLYLGLLLVGGLLVLVVRLYRLQITRGEEFATRSEANFVKETRPRADRGMLLDRRGQILVDNRPSYDVFIRPAFCQRCAEDVVPRLGQFLGWDEEQVNAAAAQVRAARRSAPYAPLPLRIDISLDQRDLIEAHLPELSGVEVEPVQHRSYRTGTTLAHVLGYMNEINQDELERLNAGGARYMPGDYIGRRGVERYFEGILRGVDGSLKEVVNARGAVISELSEEFLHGDPVVQPQPGHNVVLSVDLRLQEEAERAFTGTAGAVVVVEVDTGFVLAMVSRPSFDPNVLTGRVSPAELAKLAKDPLQPMIFRPVAQHYSPGSTFKVVTALAALRSGLFGPHTSVSCGGGYKLGSRTWRCWNDRGHGPVDARSALQRSCDTYYYRVADVLGLDPIAAVGRELGLGAPTGIAVVAEVPGIMPDSAYHDRVTPGRYTKGMALNSAIGQGDDNVTPLQLTMLYAAVANGGTLYRPQLVRRTETMDGQVMSEFKPEVVRQVAIDPEHRRLLVSALSAVVNVPGGTAYGVRLKGIEVAGKNGTAQVARLGAVRRKKEHMDYWERDHAWFAAFAPADKPKIAVVVLNEHGGHGGSDAAPIAMAVIQRYFDLQREDASAAVGNSPEDGSRAQAGG